MTDEMEILEQADKEWQELVERAIRSGLTYPSFCMWTAKNLAIALAPVGQAGRAGVQEWLEEFIREVDRDLVTH